MTKGGGGFEEKCDFCDKGEGDTPNLHDVIKGQPLIEDFNFVVVCKKKDVKHLKTFSIEVLVFFSHLFELYLCKGHI